MPHRVCPWWLGYFLASPIRRWMLKPEPVLAPYVKNGMTVLEPGPGMGFFTLPLAEMVGSHGRVIAIDLQERMITRLKGRAEKAGLLARIEARHSSADSLGIADLQNRVDFTLAFAMVHELPDGHPFFREISTASKIGALLLLSEPAGHVKNEDFEAEIRDAQKVGFTVVDRPKIRRSLAALLRKN
ncbi:MAG: class I SAM-dependent methyltransferase [Terriglobales bacterium]